jgi:hypothetical protein
MGQYEQKTASHDVASYNVLWPIRVYLGASIE